MFRRKEYEILNQMLDAAIDGTFEENCFDESELSKLQSKLMRYLSSSSLSERKIREEKENLKGLITNISHQAKTPLTNILMYTELLKESAAGSREEACANEIYTHAKRLERLMEALIKMSRLEIGVFQYEKAMVSYSGIIDKVTGQARTKAQNKEINIQINSDEDYQVNLDEKWVVEAVYNILDNAIKYSASGTTILIEAFSYELFSGIRIRDEGIGVTEEEIPLIFGRFYRGENIHGIEGIGVGLFLAREIVEGNGGYIKVKSEPGKGTIFEICFPNVSTL